MSFCQYFLKFVGYAFALAVILTVKSLIENRRIFKFARNYPGYRFYPIIGNAFNLMGKNIFQAAQEMIDKFGLPCNVWIGQSYFYVTTDPAEIQVVLNHPNTCNKMKVYENFRYYFGKTLLMAPVDVWKRHRKYYAKSFSQPVLNSFVHFFYKKSVILLDVLKDTKEKDIFEIFERYTFDSFVESIIGIDYDLQVNPKVKLAEWIGEVQSIAGKRLISYFYYPLVLWMFSREGRRMVVLVKRTRRFILNAIKERRKTFAENPVYLESTTALPLLDSMLKGLGEKFSDEHIFEEMLLFTTAATDTSGYTLAYFFTMVGMHAEVQEKIYEEVMSVIGSERPIYFDDLPNLKYTERAIMETLRILPVVPFSGRLATDDVDVGNKVIPKGSNIAICVFNLHRNEKYWPNTLKFDPDRFLPEEVAKRHPYSFIPFSAGPRNCIGKTYSIMLMKTCAANVVRNYVISSPYKSVAELKLKSCITMKTIHPMECDFKPRVHT